jgi:hypothetical protein
MTLRAHQEMPVQEQELGLAQPLHSGSTAHSGRSPFRGLTLLALLASPVWQPVPAPRSGCSPAAPATAAVFPQEPVLPVLVRLEAYRPRPNCSVPVAVPPQVPLVQQPEPLEVQPQVLPPLPGQ